MNEVVNLNQKAEVDTETGNLNVVSTVLNVASVTTVVALATLLGRRAYNGWRGRVRKNALLTGRPHCSRLAKDPELCHFLEQHFECIAANASFEDAKIIGLGEIHFTIKDLLNPDKRKLFSKKDWLAMQKAQHPMIDLLRKYAAEGDQYVTEGTPRTMGRVNPRKTMAFGDWVGDLHERGVVVSGWDCEKKDQEKIPEAQLKYWKLFGRNKDYLLPTIREKADQPGRAFFQAGVMHLVEDRSIDAELDANGIPFVLLGEKTAMQHWRKYY